MLRFFRQIRKAFLAENKFSKYALYAIGEIVLVVIGILLALQINTANSNKQDRAKEQLYLESYYNDLQANLNELDRVIKKSGQTRTTSDSLLRFSVGQMAIDSLLIIEDLIMGTTGYTLFMSQEGTINDIFGSGDLRLIRNDSIRMSMVNWSADLKYLVEFESLGKDSGLKFIEYMTSVAPFYKMSLEQPFLNKQLLDQLTADQQFLNRVSNQKRMSRITNGLYQAQKDRITALTELLARELNMQ